jgi:glutathione peroxidase
LQNQAQSKKLNKIKSEIAMEKQNIYQFKVEDQEMYSIF